MHDIILQLIMCKKKEVKIACCPIEKMVCDQSAKPTQVIFLAHRRNVVQGIKLVHFPMHKTWYEKVLRKCDLLDELENDLGDSCEKVEGSIKTENKINKE